MLAAIQAKLRAPKAIVCFQALSLSSFAVTSKAVRDCLALEGFTLNNNIVDVAEIQPRYTLVDLRNIPYEMSDASVRATLEKARMSPPC